MVTSRTSSTEGMASVSHHSGASKAHFNCRRVLLVGFMGSGKSTVGALLAERLGWVFIDFDDEIERRAEIPVSEIFRRDGEAAFRKLEAEVGADLLKSEGAVLASGGGWPVAPGRLDALEGDTLSVWLEVDTSTAVARVQGATRSRPLLQVSDPVAAAQRLLHERSPYYSKAEIHLDSRGVSPVELAEKILKHLEARAPRNAGR